MLGYQSTSGGVAEWSKVPHSKCGVLETGPWVRIPPPPPPWYTSRNMPFTLPTPPSCKECGDGPVFHGITYTSILIDEFMAGLFGAPQGGIAKAPRASSSLRMLIERTIVVPILELFIFLRLAQRVTEPDDDTQLLALMIWNEAKERGIVVEEFRLFGLARNIFMARLPNGKRIAYEGIPLPRADSARVPWMDNKEILKKEFTKLGLPVARGGAARSLSGAKKIMSSLTPPVIVKPYSGSGSRHTILHIMNEAELTHAFRVATQVAPRAVIEEELTGPVYRATVVAGVFVAALRRDQPCVVGDGKRTIAELVAEANTHPKRQGPYFHHIKLDEVADQELAWQELTRESILPEGKRAILHQKINWSVGGTTCDVTDEVHPDNIALFEETARVLGATIVGIDFIIEDISRSWKDQERCGILECNSMPFFDNHHLPFEGEPRNVAARIWDMNA